MLQDVGDEQQAVEPGCVFCRVVSGSLPSRKVYEDDQVFAFHDVTPVAKVHVLVIPKEHLTRLDEADEADDALLGHILRIGSKVAGQLGIAESGYRISVNQGADAGQVLDHLHAHVMGGQVLYPLGETSTGTEG